MTLTEGGLFLLGTADDDELPFFEESKYVAGAPLLADQSGRIHRHGLSWVMTFKLLVEVGVKSITKKEDWMGEHNVEK